MPRISVAASQLIERILGQRRSITVMHTAALIIVPLCYWIGHVIPMMPRPPFGRTGGTVGFLASIFGWGPILISWFFTSNPNEGTLWFRLWQVLFIAINAAACVIYMGLFPKLSPEHAFAWSAVHTLALAVIVPFAVDYQTTPIGK